MFIALSIFSALFALALVGSAVAKFRKVPAQAQLMQLVGLTENNLYVLGSLEVLAAIGLLVGLLWAPLSVAAAIGAIFYFVGAFIAHARIGDRKVQGAVVMLAVAIVVLILRVLSA